MFENAREWLANRLRGASEITEAPSGGSKRDPKKIAIKKIGSPLGKTGNFESSAVDLTEITKAYNSDSYIRRAVDKYAELVFKEGWDIVAKDDTISEYVWMRLKLMAEGTGQPIDEFLKEIAQDIVLYGNAFVVKARQKGSSAGATGVKAVGYTGKQPIAGYFVLPPTTIKIMRDETGKLTGYQQDAGGGNAVDIKPEDMVHFAYKRPRGRAFGVPYILPVLEDVKLLRTLEEHVARLIYRNLFPLYQYKVGLDKPGFESTPDEIEYIKEQISLMPMDGGIVLPERHDISVVSSNGAALDAEGYLKYFRQRVFTGLGVSDVVMGIGDTANRGTADNLSSEMIDGVKEFQAVFRNTFMSRILNEILFEGNYDPTLNPDHEVDFQFFEIELDAKMKKENHAIQKFTQNATTHEELRSELGKDPVTDEGRLYYNMVTASLNAQAAQEKAAAANASGSNKNQPANQNGKKPSAGKPKKSKASVETDESEEFSSNLLTESSVQVNLHSELKILQSSDNLTKLWNSFRDDVVNMARQGRTHKQIEGFVVQLVKQTMKSQIERDTTNAFYLGLNHGKSSLQVSGVPTNVYYELDQLKKISTKFTDRLAADMSSLISKALDRENAVDRLSTLSGVFNSNGYRLKFIASTEPYRAYNYALALTAKSAKRESVILTTNEDCVQCKELASKPVDLNSPSLLDAIPPHHPNCTCTIDLETPVEEV